MTGEAIATTLVYLGVCGLVLLAASSMGDRRAESRVRGLAGAAARPRPRYPDFLARLMRPFAPADEAAELRQKQRFAKAGFYDPQTVPVFMGVKAALLVVGVLAALIAVVADRLPPERGVPVGALAGLVGLAIPDFWLGRVTRARQTELRRALPDGLDMIVLCLEGGVSLSGAVQRVTDELETAHPVLAAEFNILQREMLLGVTPGEGFMKLSERCGLEEMRGLASVLIQAERYGSSITKALRLHSETLRTQRRQKAEETAQKAAVKVLFPTLLCIFPAVFVVLLGPAVFQIMGTIIKK